MRAHADLSNRFDLLISVAGIGERTALALLIRMPELGTLSREQVAALAGLAPFDDDSGKRPFGGAQEEAAISPVDEIACEKVSMPPLCQRPSNGTKHWPPCTAA
ncbi:MAG: transposase [Pseudonocardiaceae bacterium]